MEDLSKYSTEELEAMLQDSPQPQSAQPAQTQAPQAPQAPQEPASDMPDLSQYSTEDLERMIGEQGAAAGRIEQMFDVGTDRRDEIDPLEEAAKGAGRAVKAIGGAFVGLGSGAVRLAGTPVRALTGWDGLHRVADAIDSGYEDWGSEALASELPDDDWGRVIGGFGEKMVGTAGSLGAMAAGGGLAKLGAAGKFGAASKAVGTAGAALQKSLPFIFGNDAAVRTYDTAKENGSGTARALGLASVNGAIHYFGFKAFENQSLNKMLGMPQEMTAMMPAWANAAREGGAKTFTELASGVRNGMFKYILAERAKGALKAGGIMGLQNFLSSVPTQMAEGAGVGDVDWGRAVSEGLGGVEEGALMEALMGGAAMLKTPKAARKFIADTYFRNGYKLPNGQHVPGLLHSEEGRSFVMKQDPDMQARILDILDHGGKVTKGELNAACLPPDMTEAELREFAKDWKHDLEVEGWRKGEDEFLGDGEELTGSEDVRGQNAATTAAVEEERIAEDAMNADTLRNEPAPPIDAAREERAEPLSAAEAEAQQRQINDAAERDRAKQAARDAEPRIAALRQTRQESSEMGNRLEHQFDEANAQADAERNGAEQLAREEAYPRITVEQAQAARTEPSPVANGGAGTVLQEQIQRRIDAEARSEAGKKVQAEIDGFFDAVKGNRDVLGNEEFNARNADILADVDDAIRRNNPQMARDALNKLKKKVKNFAKKNRLRPATPEPPPEPPDGSEPSGGSKSNLLRRQQPRSATQSTNSLRPAATRDELNQQPKEIPNETGNVPVEAQPEPPVQDAGRGGQRTPAQAAEGLVEGEAPRGEVPAAGEVAEARPAPTATPEPEPVSKSDRGGQKLTGGAKEEATPPKAEATPPATQTEPPAAEPPKNAPTSAPSAEGTTTPPKSADAPQGGESAAGGATGDAAEEPKPTQGNKLRRGGGKKGKKLEAQEPKADATPAAPETTATPETTPAPTAADQPQPASQFRDKNGNMKKTLRGAVERISLAIGNRTGKGAITPEEADNIVNGIAESPEVKHNRTRQFFTPLVTDAEWQNSLGVDAESAKNLRDAVVRARDASQQKKQQRKLDNALRAADAGDKDAPTAYGLVRIASDALDKARTKGDKAAEARAQKALEDAQAKFLAEYERVPEANREKFVKEQEKQFEEWSKKHDDVARNESVTADAPIQGKDGSSTTMAEQLPAKSTNRVGGRYAKGYVGEIKGVDGDEVHIAYYDADGEFLRDEKVPLDTLRERGKLLKQYKELADAVEAKGEDAESTSVRFERAAPESPASRDAKFAADADYQRWLKSRKANDAEPLRQRYEMEQAKALGDAVKNAVGGVDFEYVDRDYDPAKDNPNGGRELTERGTGRVFGTFDRDTGKLKLFRGANWKTLDHELGGHATMRFAEQEAERGNRALLDKINESIDSAPQWLKDEVKSRYPDADDATLRDEIWAALRERPSEAMQKYVKTLQGRKWYNRAWDAIKTAWRGILSRMGFNRADLSGIDKMTPDEFNEFLDKAMIGGKTLGKIETASPQSSVRMARGPAAPGHRILDDEITRGEKFREAVDDSRIIVRHVQDEIGYRDKKKSGSLGIEEVMDPKTGFVDWRKSSDMDQAADKVNGFEQKHGHILQTRLDAITKELSGMKGLSEEAARELAKKYLIALHAEERNRTVATRRKDTYNDDYAEGAGISKADADKILASADVQKYKPQLQEISRIVREVANEDLRLRMENGLLSQDQYNFYTKKWKNYVPLRTDVTDNGRLTEEAGVFNSSTASLGRNEFRTARGRGKGNIADDPISFLFAQANDGIVKSGQNVIGNVSANAVGVADAKNLNKTTVTRPDGSTATEYMMAEIVPADVVKHGGTEFAFTFADGTKARVGGDMQLVSNQENIQLFKRPEPVLDDKGNPVLDASGKPKMEARLYAIRWNPGANRRGVALAKALKGDNMTKVQWWMRPFANATRYLSRMNTSMSPSFLTSNIFNDRNEAWRTLMARFGVLDGSAMAAKVWGNRYRDGKAIKAWIENGDLSQSADFKQFIDGGGSIKGGNVAHGYSGELQMIQDNYAKYERASKSWLERLTSIRDSNGKISPRHWLKMQGKLLRDVGNVVQTANEVEEIGTRYGVYKVVRDQLIKQGVDPNTAHGEAIKFSREATTNFNRRGTFAPVIGSFYMFWNANVQGHKRNLQTLTDKHNVQTFATLAGLAVATTLLRTWFGNDEEKKKAGGRIANNAPEHQKQASMGILMPGGTELTILKTRGIDSLIPYAATKFTEAIVQDDVKAKDALGDIFEAVAGEAAGVLGGNGVANKSQAAQTFMPSVIDPIIQWTSGTDWKGEPRVKQSFSKTAPKSYNGKNNTHPAFKWIAETVNNLTTGNSLRKGWVDMAPEDVQLIVETLAGGLGRDITGAMNTYSNVKSVVSGGSSDRMFSQMPVVKSLFREYPESTSRYYAALEEYDADKAEFKGTRELGRRAELKKAHPYLTAKKGRVDALIEQVQELTHRERGEVKVGQKWVPMKTELPEARKEAFRKRRLRLQAEVLRILGK